MTPLAAAFPRPVDLLQAKFSNSFVAELPADPVTANVPRQVQGACYTLVQPTPVAAPKLLAWSSDLATELGIGKLSTDILAGNLVTDSMRPFAARYGGHQFGHWAGQLGDGRAITLGEINGQELQLKGAGLTPYSRTADGRAVLRSSLREFLCSEAMHWLGVPTTRALALVGTGQPVMRDMFYDGNPAAEPGAIVCRVAPSFVRFGNFQILEEELKKQLADYVIRHHYSGLSYAEFFQEVCRRTALLMVDWMRLGFVHGVMNTDNLSILGVTIDYGPYGWLEGYDPQWTPNTTDLPGRRYCYGNQPQIALWNLTRLAEALVGFVEKEKLEKALEVYVETYQERMTKALADKLGLETVDEPLMTGLFSVLGSSETDFTLFFRNLAKVEKPSDIELLRPAFYAEPDAATVSSWLALYLAQARPGRAERMNAVNPKYIFRNYLAVQAIEALEKGDASLLERLMRVLARPYDEQPQEEDLAARRPEWARDRAGCSALSCSS